MLSETEGQFLTLHELVKGAHQRLSRNMWDYLVGGAETETTLLRNRAALDSIGLKPRVLRDVSSVDLSSTFLGRRIALPLVIAPVAGLESFEAGGSVSVAAAASEAGIPMFLSSVAKPGIEEVAAAHSGSKVFQLYVRGDDAWVDDFVRRAVDSGFDAFCFTVDTAVHSRRERDIASRFAKPWRAKVTGTDFQAGFSWSTLERFMARHRIRVVLKGIANGEDAARACEMGVAAIYVSNHGGRQLDHGIATIDSLPEVAAAVAGRAQVIVDGGFYRGTDVLKAIALGADLVGLGRAFCYGLAAAGKDGVARVLALLEDEIGRSLALMGATSLGDLSPESVARVAPVVQPGPHSAYPLMNLRQEGY